MRERGVAIADDTVLGHHQTDRRIEESKLCKPPLGIGFVDTCFHDIALRLRIGNPSGIEFLPKAAGACNAVAVVELQGGT